MPDEENEQIQEETKEKPKKPILQWAITGVVVMICASAGFFLARSLKGAVAPATVAASQEDADTEPDDLLPDDGKTWFHDLEPVVANLNDPGVMRYVSAALTLEMSAAAAQGKTVKLFEEKMPILTNWLTIYLASLSLEDIRGDKNLKRIQAQILDAFNQELFPNEKPKIKHILFKGFAIQ
ncbi:MAG: flagellar basal body-associated FliL family protein [Sedimentisphaerales bacterium]|nr:flagellar basal body-associated FliL family protein [Sedimentisphaerales bacterium]